MYLDLPRFTDQIDDLLELASETGGKATPRQIHNLRQVLIRTKLLAKKYKRLRSTITESSTDDVSLAGKKYIRENLLLNAMASEVNRVLQGDYEEYTDS